jgi:hypothetical protein
MTLTEDTGLYANAMCYSFYHQPPMKMRLQKL